MKYSDVMSRLRSPEMRR